MNITELSIHNTTSSPEHEKSQIHIARLQSNLITNSATTGSSGTISNITNAASSIAEIDTIRWKLTLDKAASHLSLKRSYLEKYMPSPFRTGALAQAFVLVGKGLDAITGLRATGTALTYDLKNNDKQFTNTMKTICKSVARTNAAFAVGALAVSATATMTTSVIIPAAIGVGLSIGTGYLLEQGLAIIGRPKITFRT